MTPIVKHHRYMSQINTTPIYDNTTISLRDVRKAVMIYQNDQIIALVEAPIMKIVRAIRSMFPNANMQLI